MSHHLTPLLKICSLHFEKICFGSCRIRSWAIPTLYLGHNEAPEHLNKTTIRQEVYDAPEDISEIQLKQVKIKRSLDSAKCSVSSCRKSRLKHGVRFYNLPLNLKMKRKWLHNLQISHLKASHKVQNIKVCNHHFHKRCLEGKILKPWAVPTRHLGHTEAVYDNPRKLRALPPIRCVLTHCKNHTGSKAVRSFVFPKSPEFLEKWSKNLKLELEKCRGRICDEHFEKEVLGVKKLKNGAVPTLNLGHTDQDIYNNTELIEKLKLKQSERELKKDSCKVKIVEDDLDEEYEPHTEDEEEDLWELEEGEEEEDEEQLYFDDIDEEEDEGDHGDDNEESRQDEDEISVSNSISDWSSIKFKELRVSITPLTPEDLMDLCSRSSYEREFGSLTPASSLRGRRSVTPASSWKDLRPETPDQKPNNFNSCSSRSETPDKRTFNCFREPRSVTPEQKVDNFREPRSPDRKSVSPKDPLGESFEDLCSKTSNYIESLVFAADEKTEADLTAVSLKRENSQTNNETSKRERLEISEEETTNNHSLNKMEYTTTTNLRTDKALNAVAPICCLKHCGKEKTPEQHLTTYGFPKDPQLLQKWCDNLGLQPEECIGRVCIDHFELRVIGTRRLKLGAVPTLNLGPNRIAKHTNIEDTAQKKSVTKEFSETGNMQEIDSSLRPPPPYKTPKPSKQSVFRLCCLKHCRRKKFLKQEKQEKQQMKELKDEKISCQEKRQELLFKFPTDHNILRKWYKNLRIPAKLSTTTDLRICSKHFDPGVIKNGKLHPKAVPTLQLSDTQQPIYKNNLSSKIKQKSKMKCYLPHCGNKMSDHIFLFPFPETERTTLRKWCKNLKLNYEQKKYKGLKICSVHFESYVFFKKKHLRTGALPTLNLGHTDAIIRNCRRLRLKRENKSSIKEKCCISDCQTTNMKLYSFPRSSELRKIWCNNLQIELRHYYKICARHFAADSFIVGTDNLKLNAVPVLNLGLNTQSHLLLTTNPDESKCIVENCQKTPSVDKVKLFKFPQKQDLLKKWLFNLNLSADTFNPLDVVCSKHFDKSCIKNGILHENAIPTQFLEVSPKGWFYKNNEDLYEMPRKCCVLNCEKTSEDAKHFYRFPKHKEDLEKWLYNLKLQVEESDIKDLRVCDRHFEQSCKISNKDLITQALPTLNLGHDDGDIYGNNFIKCCLDNCNIDGFYYHKLPEDLMLQSYWFQELEMETTYNTSLYICSVHFVAFYERILEKYSAFLKESKEYEKLSVTYNELKALPALQCYKCHITKCNSGFKLIWKLFKFPKDVTLFGKWLHNTSLKFDYDQRHCYRICAQHFEERCLSEKKLHRWSLPTLKLPFNNSLYVNPPEALPSNHENLKHCCVANCPTEKGPFYKFPIKQLEVRKWIHNLDLGTQQCTLNLRVCYKHFENYCFSKAVNKVKHLKSWSVPTLRLKRKTELFLNPADKIAFYVCCLESCRQILNKSKEIHLFKFPFSNTLKNKWLHNLNVGKQEYKESMRVCSAHFEMDCFYKGFKLLRKHSVPTLGLSKPPAELYRNPVRRAYFKCCVKMCKAPWEQLSNFPKDKTLLRKWCHNLQLDKEIKLESLRDWKICNRHFEQQCINKFGSVRSMAVPTLKLGHRKKIFKNQVFALKANPKIEENKIKNEDSLKPMEVTETKLLQLNLEKDKLEKNSNENDLKKTNLETKSLLSKKLLNFRPLKALRKPKFVIKKQQNVKTKTRPNINNLKAVQKNIKAQQFRSVKEKKILLEAGLSTTDEEEDKPLQQLKAEKQEQTVIEPSKRQIPENAANPPLNEVNKAEISETLKKEQTILESDLPEDVYLENLLEILTESPEPFKQEETNSDNILRLEAQTQQERKYCHLSNDKEKLFFTVNEIKQEILDDSVQNDEAYLEERPDYKPSEHSDSDHEILEQKQEEEEGVEKNINFRSKNLNSCCIKTCRNYNNFKTDVALYKLPNIRKLRDHWLTNCKLNQRQYSANGVLKRLRVCIEHFHKHCIKDNNRLLFGAVPTLQLGSELDCEDTLKKFSYLRCRIKSCQRSCQYDKINRIPFPQGELKTKWCFNLNMEEKTITDDDWICHRHFEKKALIDCRKPKPNVIPTLLLDSEEMQKTSTINLSCSGGMSSVTVCRTTHHKDFKLKCLYPSCKGKHQVLYDWPCQGIFHIIWIVAKKIDRQVEEDANAWKKLFKQALQNKEFSEISKANTETNIKLCDEHFYYLYKINEIALNNEGSAKECKVLKQNVQLIFDSLNSLEKIYTKQCAVPQCKTDQNIKSYKSLKLFSFPPKDMAKKWCQNIGIEYSYLQTKPHLKICELHFESYCILRRNLLDWALPTLNLPLTNESKNVIPNDAAKIIGEKEKCCIRTCPNAQDVETKTTTRLYKFPKDAVVLKKWLKNTNCEKTFDENVTRICGLHFQASDIINKRTELREQAIPKYYLDLNLNFTNSSPTNSVIDENIQVKQELDNSEEWCASLAQDSFTNDNTMLKTQATENLYELKLKENNNKESFYNQMIEIKQEIIEIQEEEPQTSLFTIQKFETVSPPNAQNFYADTDNNQPAAFVISDVKSQIYLCCVQKCTNSSETVGIRMFNEFPNDSEIFIKWCFNLKIDPRNYKENQYAICEQHFEPICFTDSGLLQAWSVPTLNLNLNENSFIHQNDIPEHLKLCPEQCIVYGCINPLKPLFKFPYNPDNALKWFANLKLDYTDFRAQNYRICRRHFSAVCFEIGDINKLKIDAVPTQFLGHTEKICHFNSMEESQWQPDAIAAGLNNQDNSRGSSQGSLARIISPHDLEDHDSSYFEDFEEYYGQDE